MSECKWGVDGVNWAIILLNTLGREEENLESRASIKEEIRYDLTFYSPSCRYVRVKVHVLLLFKIPVVLNFSRFGNRRRA